MINLFCGWDVQRHLLKRGGCGIRVGYVPIPLRGHLPITPRKPYFFQGIAYCENCYRDTKTRHLGFGLLVRPAEESDVPVGGPSLEALYDGDPMPYRNKKQPTWPGLHVHRP